MLRRLACAATALTAFAAPAAAQADFVTIGSDLTQSATVTQSFPRDWVAFPTAFASGGMGVVSPVRGEVTQVTFKGTVLKPDNPAYQRSGYPRFNFKIAVLRPLGDGSFRFLLASNDLTFPFGGDPQQLSTFTLNTDGPRICVDPGDIVALATSGGFGAKGASAEFGGSFPDNFFADGYPVQMFGRASGSSYGLFEQPAPGGDDGNGFQVGDVERGTPQRGQELLMQARIGTVQDARSFCRSPEEENLATRPRVSLPEQSSRLRVSSANTLPLQLRCESISACSGNVYLKHGSKPVSKAAPFSLASGTAGTVGVTVNANGLRLLKQRAGKLAVTVTVRPKGGARVDQAFKLVRPR